MCLERTEQTRWCCVRKEEGTSGAACVAGRGTAPAGRPPLRLLAPGLACPPSDRKGEQRGCFHGIMLKFASSLNVFNYESTMCLLEQPRQCLRSQSEFSVLMQIVF